MNSITHSTYLYAYIPLSLSLSHTHTHTQPDFRSSSWDSWVLLQVHSSHWATHEHHCLWHLEQVQHPSRQQARGRLALPAAAWRTPTSYCKVLRSLWDSWREEGWFSSSSRSGVTPPSAVSLRQPGPGSVPLSCSEASSSWLQHKVSLELFF